MFRSAFGLGVALSVGVVACATDEVGLEDEVEVTDQELAAPIFRLASIQFSNSVLIPNGLSPGSKVMLRNRTFSSLERFTNVNLQIIHEDSKLCVQPSSGSSGASLVLQTCNGSPLQGWSLRKKPNGNVRYENLNTGLYMDAFGVASPLEIRPFSGQLDQEFVRQF